jgi:hypothetical protein
MPAPLTTFIQLPSDSTNSGKMLRAESKVIAAQTVLEQFVVPVHALTVTGNYWSDPGPFAVIAGTQNGTSTGSFWLQNPVASTVTVLLKNVSIDVSANAATAAPTAPYISFQKFTFSGTASGASITSLPYATGTTASQAIMRTAVTGMTVTLVQEFASFDIPAILTAVGVYGGVKHTLIESPQAYVRGQFLELAPGEGMLCYQPTAGTASDPRVFGVNVRWMEIDLS